MRKEVRFPKNNGFSRRLNWKQFLSYCLLVGKISLFQIFFVSNFLVPYQIAFSILYDFTILLTIVFGLLVTLSDPSDEVMVMEKTAKMAGVPFENSQYSFHCRTCDTSVSGETIKHCHTCGRCVNGFDHHCDWVNNCIAKKNYRMFIVVITSLFISTATFVTAGILFAIDYYTRIINIIEDIEAVHESIGLGLMVLIFISMAINVLIMLPILVLISFHCYIYRLNLTTYDFIVKYRERHQNPSSNTHNRNKSLKIKNTRNDSTNPPLESNDNFVVNSEGDKHPSLNKVEDCDESKYHHSETTESYHKSLRQGLFNSSSVKLVINTDKSFEMTETDKR